MGNAPVGFPIMRSKPRDVQRCGLHKLPNCKVFHGRKLDKDTTIKEIDERHKGQIKIVCISDTHSMHRSLDIPSGDILIHAGDFTNTGGVSEIQDFELFATELLEKGKFKHVILVAGNHDITLDPLFYTVTGREAFHKDNPQNCEIARESLKNVIYLEDDYVIVEGIKIYGSPWQPDFHDWAFCLERGSDRLRQKWAGIPDDTDILVTHTPPAFHGDGVKVALPGHTGKYGTVKYGCEDLLEFAEKVHPKLHIFGHIHQGYGVTRQKNLRTTFINAAICTSKYEPQNKPIVCYLNRPGGNKLKKSVSSDFSDVATAGYHQHNHHRHNNHHRHHSNNGTNDDDDEIHQNGTAIAKKAISGSDFGEEELVGSDNSDGSRNSVNDEGHVGVEDDAKSTYSRCSYHSKRYSDVSAQYKYSNPGPIWHEDDDFDNCERCNSEFTLIKRKHHCRRCGSVICAECSGFVHLFYFQRQGESVRVCLKDCPALKLPHTNACAISA